MGKVIMAGGKPNMIPSWEKFPAIFSEASWAQIIRACETRRVPDSWLVGTSKAMTINGTDYFIDIIGKDHDDYADGSGKAPLTFQLHDCYATTYAMNSADTNVGGWAESAMRNTHLPSIFELMPSEVQEGIKEVLKITTAGNKDTALVPTADKLFLLAQVEAKTAASGYDTEGVRYEYYLTSSRLVKNRLGSAEIWWYRSPYLTNTAAFVTQSTSVTAASSSGGSTLRGVAFAFCF